MSAAPPGHGSDVIPRENSGGAAAQRRSLEPAVLALFHHAVHLSFPQLQLICLLGFIRVQSQVAAEQIPHLTLRRERPSTDPQAAVFSINTCTSILLETATCINPLIQFPGSELSRNAPTQLRILRTTGGNRNPENKRTREEVCYAGRRPFKS